MVSRSTIGVLTFALALHVIGTVASFAEAAPAAPRASQADSAISSAEPVEDPTSPLLEVKKPLEHEANRHDSSSPPETRLAFSIEEHDELVDLSLTDDNREERLSVFSLSAELEVDKWSHATVRPIGLAGWLVGRENAWGVHGHSREEKIADMFNDLGNTLPAGITAGLLLSDSPSSKRTGRCSRDAMVVTAAATHLLKLAIDSPRPANPELLDGFPSGHTSMSMAFARAIAENNSDWGTAAYLWAGGVGWSRVRRGDHTVEQVLAGALLGWFVGDLVADDYHAPRVSTPRGRGPIVPAARASW